MTTVGYGDVFPRTPAGKFVGAVTAMLGIIVIAFPVTLIGSAFNEVWNAAVAKKAEEKAKKAAKKNGGDDAVAQLKELANESKFDRILDVISKQEEAIAKQQETLKQVREMVMLLRDDSSYEAETVSDRLERSMQSNSSSSTQNLV